MKKFLLALSAAVVRSGAALVPTAPAMARSDHHYDRGDHYRGHNYRRDRHYRGDRYYRGDRHYRGGYYRCADRRYYRCYRCDSGTGGTILGAPVGGLRGNEVVGGSCDRTAGALGSAGVGALAGRALDRDGYGESHLPRTEKFAGRHQ